MDISSFSAIKFTRINRFLRRFSIQKLLRSRKVKKIQYYTWEY